jgi:hypothetical protein
MGGAGGSAGAGGRGGSGGSGAPDAGSFDASNSETVPVIDGGTRTDAVPPPPVDGGSFEVALSPCDPVKQVGCAQQAEACYVYPDNAWQCLLPGTGGEGAPCQGPSSCRPGTGCFSGPEGSLCRQYCNPVAPACSSKNPVCQVLPGSRWGTCVAGTAATDAGPPPVSCDPIGQTGCSRSEDACHAFPGTDLACLLAGPVPWLSTCSVSTDCQRGAGCFDGPGGRLCRPYCRLGGGPCPANAPVCMNFGRAEYGVCAMAATVDGGSFEAGMLPASMMPN